MKHVLMMQDTFMYIKGMLFHKQHFKTTDSLTALFHDTILPTKHKRRRTLSPSIRAACVENKSTVRLEEQHNLADKSDNKCYFFLQNKA